MVVVPSRVAGIGLGRIVPNSVFPRDRECAHTAPLAGTMGYALMA
jgi:hypothetical protein